MMTGDRTGELSLPTAVDFGRGICDELAAGERREWLVTNGIGGYASGAVASTVTRRYHGLLIAALDPPLGRTLLATKFDEAASYDGLTRLLFANRWQGGLVEPAGYAHCERFRLEGTTPVWTFACADALLEKRVWMQAGANTTYIRYDLVRGSGPLSLTVKALTNCRDHHASTHVDQGQEGRGPDAARVIAVEHGLQVTAFDGAPPLYLLSATAAVTPRCDWYRGYLLSVEAFRGLDPLDDNLYAGDFSATLQAGESLTIVAATNAAPDLDGSRAYAGRLAYETQLLARARSSGRSQTVSPAARDGDPAWIQQLVLAADQFIVGRDLPAGAPGAAATGPGQSVIAGYPWFSDWGRDTMIALPGLALTTGRPEIAAAILRTFAHYVDQGMLPNRFPDVGTRPEYNTVDATLWYFEAIRSYHAATGDDALLAELYPALAGIVDWHERGTRYHIQRDPADGLLYAGEPGVQLTWMDAKVGDWVVTPRIGKPVEVNALWHHALVCMGDFAVRLGQPAGHYRDLAGQAVQGFGRFWNGAAGCLFDVLDGPAGNDAAVRPNQLFAVALPPSPLPPDQQKAVVDACARQLVASIGLRSLTPADPAYLGKYGGDQHHRDAAYHQGTGWAWLIGPFISAHLQVYGDRTAARSFLAPFARHLSDHGLGSISEIFEGDAPFMPRGCIAQAWSVAEVLRAWEATAAVRP